MQDSHGHGWRKGKWALSLSQGTACWGLPASSLSEGCSLRSQAFEGDERFCSQVYPEFKGVSHFPSCMRNSVGRDTLHLLFPFMCRWCLGRQTVRGWGKQEWLEEFAFLAELDSIKKEF